jgi:hypothetical protein
VSVATDNREPSAEAIGMALRGLGPYVDEAANAVIKVEGFLAHWRTFLLGNSAVATAHTTASTRRSRLPCLTN